MSDKSMSFLFGVVVGLVLIGIGKLFGYQMESIGIGIGAGMGLILYDYSEKYDKKNQKVIKKVRVGSKEITA